MKELALPSKVAPSLGDHANKAGGKWEARVDLGTEQQEGGKGLSSGNFCEHPSRPWLSLNPVQTVYSQVRREQRLGT